MALVVGVVITCELAFTQSTLRFFAIVGLICVFYGWVVFPFSLANYFTEIYKKGYRFLSYLYLCFLIVVTVFLGLFYTNWFDEQENKLNGSGELMQSKVEQVNWESRGKGASNDGNYVYYRFAVDGKTYEHSVKNDTLKKGDEIIILYLPSNPSNHKIKSKK
ncbi:DUF3592 domain-containing protein [Pontibacter cellulosilyticus]|nr:hypothetical protein [Pontibacter cellulosilyticus]